MPTSYDVAIWSISPRKWKTKTTYYVRWRVAKRRKEKPFRTRPLADSFRSQLMTAARKGEPFDIDTGLPPTLADPSAESWFSAACRFVDAEWKRSAAGSRKSTAESLTAITEGLLPRGRGRPDGVLLRAVLKTVAFRTGRRDVDLPSDEAAVLRWVERHSPPVSVLSDASKLRGLLDHLSVRVDSKPGQLAPTVVRRRHGVLKAFVRWAIEEKIFRENPFDAVTWKAPSVSSATRVVDKSSVPGPPQVRTILRELQSLGPAARRLYAYFACIWLTGMRPEEAVSITAAMLRLPPGGGWGEIVLSAPRPNVGSDWTDSGELRDDRDRLKGRERGEKRPVPCPPELTAILLAHIAEFGLGPGGLVFTGVPRRRKNGGPVVAGPVSYAYSLKLWHEARQLAFTPEVTATDLARTPYHLRHAGVSTMLAGGMQPTEVAEIAGHSLEMLLKVYAQIVDGGQAERRRRHEEAFGYRPGPLTQHTHKNS